MLEDLDANPAKTAEQAEGDERLREALEDWLVHLEEDHGIRLPQRLPRPPKPQGSDRPN
jgi:hypothetical protein